jgi:hypothetical protein
MADPKKKQEPPPGDFVSDDLRRQTERFLEDLMRRLQNARAEQGPRLGPPKHRC